MPGRGAIRQPRRAPLSSLNGYVMETEAPLGPLPMVHTAPQQDEWLRREVIAAVAKGVPYGSGQFAKTPRQLEAVAHDGEFLWHLQKELEERGVHGFDRWGTNDLPKQGVNKVAFSSGDNVVKLGWPGTADFEAGNLPDSVWGVVPPTHLWESRVPGTQDAGGVHQGLGVFIQPRTQLEHPKWGTPNGLDQATLAKALKYQGWAWTDDHLGNLAFVPGEDYRPAVIDGRVFPWPKEVSATFTPPTKPSLSYEWLLPLMTGAAAAGASQQQGPLSGLMEQ